MKIDKEHLERAYEWLDAQKLRSSWDKGVRLYARELMENLEWFVEHRDDIPNMRLAEKRALNGASDWRQYSYGGCSLCYDREIAARLCTPYELKETDGGRKPPNKCEDWIDVQARALFQAWEMCKDALLATAKEDDE